MATAMAITKLRNTASITVRLKRTYLPFAKYPYLTIELEKRNSG
jgi:hypothetical protein